jgi:hypothetical protein
MKRKFIFTLSLASLICSNAFAMEMTGSHLISHKESTTGPSKALFKVIDVKDNQLSSMKNLLTLQPGSKQNQFVSASVQANDVPPSILGSFFHLSGMHRDFIMNESSETQTYVIRHNVCVDIMKSEGIYQQDTCASSIDQVELDPKGRIGNVKEMDLNVVLSDPSLKYFEHAETIIFNQDGNTIYQSADIKPIVVNPAK